MPAFDAIFSLEPRADAAGAAAAVDAGRKLCRSSHCDPTQASAIALARTGRDFIIQGPPGTGKSQTITNLIADYVARGKRVLFVCEKRAAIDVVYHRLQQAGLHQLSCLIHDSQADKKAFIMDMKENYERLLEGQDKESAADKRRQKLIAGVSAGAWTADALQLGDVPAPPQAGHASSPSAAPGPRTARTSTELSDLDNARDCRLTPSGSRTAPCSIQPGRVACSTTSARHVLSKHPLRHLSCRVAQEDQAARACDHSRCKLDEALDE